MQFFDLGLAAFPGSAPRRVKTVVTFANVARFQVLIRFGCMPNFLDSSALALRSGVCVVRFVVMDRRFRYTIHLDNYSKFFLTTSQPPGA